MTTKEDIQSWFKRGVDKKATHMIVMCDTFDYEDYPIYVLPGQDVRATVSGFPRDMQKVMEVYDLHLDMEEQLNEHRALHY